MELFKEESPLLSKRMMPKRLSEFVGQSHLVGKSRPIESMVRNKILHSMLFYGPPATGKTSLAEILSTELDYRFVKTNALHLDSDEIRAILKGVRDAREKGQKTIVFIDEIHRLIKPKQDAFLPALETGELILIGATTENPYFIIQPAFRSRVFIYKFEPHTREEIESIIQQALQNDAVLSKLGVEMESGVMEFLIQIGGDARRALNILEIAVLAKPSAPSLTLTKEDIQSVTENTDTKYSNIEGHYDVISAFIKSVRGSDIDAALYYLAFMLESGEDPLFIARRLIILAAEDIGLAYPEGLTHAVSCYQALQFIGMPEGRIILAETTILLAGVPKSNSAIISIDKAMEDVRNGNIMNVPPPLRQSHYNEVKNTGRESHYLYPHEYPNHYVPQNYTEKLVSYYSAGELGFEKKIAEWMRKLRDGEDK